MTGSRINVLHVGAGRYPPDNRSHSTFDIWRQLVTGFGAYTVVGRSTEPNPSRIDEGNISVHLLASRFASEAEFLATQFRAVPIAVAARSVVTVSQCPVLGGLAGLRLRRKSGAKLLVELHGLHYFTDARFGSSDWLIQRISARVLPRADRIRVLSEGMRRRLLARYGNELESRVVCIPPRVDLEIFKNVRQSWALAGRARIAMIGGVNENKGQHRVIETLLKAGLDVEIWIFGEGPDLEKCRATAVALGGGDRVRFFGRIDHQELAEKLPQADALVVFSRREATPRAILEAMAAAVPIVTVDVGFCPDLVTDGVEGFVLSDDPRTQLVTRLRELLADETLRARMGRAGRARAERDFDARSVFERYRALIAETAAS